eukprot:2777366-Rhodomonas_salina.1
MFVAPPERPLTKDEKLKDLFYAKDIAHISMCSLLFGKGHGDALHRSAELKTQAEKQSTRMPPRPTEIVPVPQHWTLTFKSHSTGEVACGDKSIPAILGKLWFMREAVTGPVPYTLVQLSSLSYIGCLRNVAGFNVFFQVNCHMPYTDVT